MAIEAGGFDWGGKRKGTEGDVEGKVATGSPLALDHAN
jgi:hypothetical protein